jgi:hypothetical protein
MEQALMVGIVAAKPPAKSKIESIRDMLNHWQKTLNAMPIFQRSTPKGFILFNDERWEYDQLIDFLAGAFPQIHAWRPAQIRGYDPGLAKLVEGLQKKFPDELNIVNPDQVMQWGRDILDLLNTFHPEGIPEGAAAAAKPLDQNVQNRLEEFVALRAAVPKDWNFWIKPIAIHLLLLAAAAGISPRPDLEPIEDSEKQSSPQLTAIRHHLIHLNSAIKPGPRKKPLFNRNWRNGLNEAAKVLEQKRMPRDQSAEIHKILELEKGKVLERVAGFVHRLLEGEGLSPEEKKALGDAVAQIPLKSRYPTMRGELSLETRAAIGTALLLNGLTAEKKQAMRDLLQGSRRKGSLPAILLKGALPAVLPGFGLPLRVAIPLVASVLALGLIDDSPSKKEFVDFQTVLRGWEKHFKVFLGSSGEGLLSDRWVEAKKILQWMDLRAFPYLNYFQSHQMTSVPRELRPDLLRLAMLAGMLQMFARQTDEEQKQRFGELYTKITEFHDLIGTMLNYQPPGGPSKLSRDA